MANYLLRELAGFRVQYGYALLSCVQIAAYNLHLGLLRPEPFWLDHRKVYSVRGEADVVMTSGTLHITQYQKAPTFAVSCESLNTTLPEKERLL